MAQIIQVLIFSALFLSVYGQHHKGRSRNRNQDDKRRSDLLNLSNLLQTAARLAYPITSSITTVVGSLTGSNNYAKQPKPKRHYNFNSYDRYPVYGPSSRGRNKAGRNNYRSGPRNMRMRNNENPNRRQRKPNIYDYYYDYDYEYNYDYDNEYLESYESSELDDIYYNYGIQSKPETITARPKAPVFKEADNEQRISLPKPPLGPQDVKPHNKLPLSATEVVETKTQFPISSNLGNQGNNAKPLINSNVQELNYPTSVGGETAPGNIPNLQSPPSVTNAVVNNGNPGSVFPALNDAQPNIIYVVLKPDVIDHDIDPRSLANNYGPIPNGDTLNRDNGFYISPNGGIVSPNLNNPAGLTSADGTLAVDIPVNFMPTNSMSRMN